VEAEANVKRAVRECLAVRRELGLALTVATKQIESPGLMPPVPLLRPAEVVGVFERFGWRVVRRRGSHIILTKPGSLPTLCDTSRVACVPKVAAW
jgi:hypothetical protein